MVSTLLVLFVSVSQPGVVLGNAENAGPSRLGCTAVAIDGAASPTGTAFATENTDCNNCDFRLTYVAPKVSAVNASRPIYMNPVSYPRFVGGSRGKIYRPQLGQADSVPVGYIPEVRSTFGYYESVSPLMNDRGLGMGESSCSAMLQNKPPGSDETREAPTGILDAMTMMQLALERCATARCAVELIGALGEEYGFLPYGGEPTQGEIDGRAMFADSGEGYTLADATGEAWVLNIMGGVQGVTKAVWAARRVPKGHMAVVANEFTLAELPDEPNDDYLYSPNIFRAAKVAGLWDGKGVLHFTRVFAPDPTKYFTNGPPIPLYTSLRRWGLMRKAAPSLDLQFSFDHRDYGFSVKVEFPVSHREVFNFMKEYYADTEFDMSQGVLAGPYETPFRVEGGPKSVGQPPRGVSILRTLYSTITASGPAGTTLWYAPDTPLTSVYIPLDPKAGATGVAETYQLGHNREFNRAAAWWAFGFVNNWMQLNYKGMSTKDVYPRIERWQDHIDTEWSQMHEGEPDTAALGRWQVQLQERIVEDWWSLADQLVMKWNDMSHTDVNTADIAVGYPEWWARMVGFSNDVHPVWVQPAAKPEASCHVPGYVPLSASLPRDWDTSAKRWVNWSNAPLLITLDAIVNKSSAIPMWLSSALTGCVTGVLGFLIGRRSPPKSNPLLG